MRVSTYFMYGMGPPVPQHYQLALLFLTTKLHFFYIIFFLISLFCFG